MAAVHPSRSACAGDQGLRNSSPRPVGALADRLYQVVFRAVFDQGQHRAPESSAGQTCAEAARNGPRFSRQKIEFLAGIFEECPRTFMRLIHELSDFGQITHAECVHRRRHAGILADNMPGAAQRHTLQTPGLLTLVKHLRGCVTQFVHSQHTRRFLAFGAAIIVGAVRERMLHPALHDDEARFRRDRNTFDFQ